MLWLNVIRNLCVALFSFSFNFPSWCSLVMGDLFDLNEASALGDCGCLLLLIDLLFDELTDEDTCEPVQQAIWAVAFPQASTVPRYSLSAVPRFCYADKDDAYCRAHFRMTKSMLEEMWVLLRLPETLHLSNRSSHSGFEALLILLRRYAYPNRLADLRELFGIEPTKASRIISAMSLLLYEWYGTQQFMFDMIAT
jgi:hypothetical protein